VRTTTITISSSTGLGSARRAVRAMGRSDGQVADDSARAGAWLVLGYLLGIVGCCGLSSSTQQGCGCRRLDSGGANNVETYVL
jgi:hypothetical protein